MNSSALSCCRLAVPGFCALLVSCAVTPPPAVRPEEPGVLSTDFTHKNRPYRAKMTLESRVVEQKDGKTIHIALKARGRVYHYNPRTEFYDIPAGRGSFSGGDMMYSVMLARDRRLHMTGGQGGGGGGDSGIEGWNGEVSIRGEPPNNTEAEEVMDVTTTARYEIARNYTGADGRPVLAAVTAPLKWRVQIRKDDPAALECIPQLPAGAADPAFSKSD